jgi:hypothetical protein
MTVLTTLWSTQIVVDNGTPEGFQAVSEARERLLELGRTTAVDGEAEKEERRSRRARRRAKAREADVMGERDDGEVEVGGRKALVIGDEVFYEDGGEAFGRKEQTQQGEGKEVVGSHVLAPVRWPIRSSRTAHAQEG